MSSQPNEQTLVLKEILKWVKFTGLKEVKGILLGTVNNDSKKIVVYHLSDGNHGAREIATIASVGDNTVFGLWDLWLKMGLGENIPVRGGVRFKRSFDLQELGIELPEISETKGKKQVPEVISEKPNAATGKEGQNV